MGNAMKEAPKTPYQITLRIDCDVANTMKIMALIDNQSVSDFCTKAIYTYLESRSVGQSVSDFIGKNLQEKPKSR